MPIGSSDGQYFENVFDYHKRMSDAKEMAANEMSGDFQSRFGASYTSRRMPSEAPELTADALKSSAGREVPEKPTEKGFFDRLSIFSAIKGMGNPNNYQEDVGIIKGLVGAVLAPGEAWQGKLPMWAVGPDGEVKTSPDVVQKANDLATFAVLGPAPVAKKMADGTLGSFAGVRSKALDRNALAEAQVMEANGAVMDDIYSKTGMFRGADNRWRFEIDDSGARFAANWQYEPSLSEKYLSYGGYARITPLPKIYDHPELYKAYPWLRDTKVVYDPKHPSAAMIPGSNSIILGKINNIGAVQHEVQHLIQEYEGMAAGGAPGTAGKEYNLKYQQAFDNLKDEVLNIYKKITSGKEVSIEDKLKAERFVKAAEKFPEYRASGDAKAVENYMNLAGEVEARNVETRALLDAQERRQIPPWATEDVVRRQQIIVNEPSLTTPYGAWDRKSGTYVKAQKD